MTMTYSVHNQFSLRQCCLMLTEIFQEVYSDGIMQTYR